MPDPMIALRALRQIRGGGDSPVRRLAERAARSRMAEPPETEIEIDPKEGSVEIGLESGSESGNGGHGGMRDAMDDLAAIFSQLDTGYTDREALRASPELPPSYLAAGEAPRVGGMEDDEEDDLDRSVAALFRGR